MESEVELCVEVGSNIGDTWVENADINQLCRSCANTHDNMIPIFEGDGLEHDLQNKIDKHFPVNISRDDGLPHQMCYQCASTLVAWHDMYMGCIDAENKLKNLLKKSTAKGQVEKTVAGSSIASAVSASVEPDSQQKMASEMEVDNDDNDDDDDDDDVPEHGGDDNDDEEDDDDDNDDEDEEVEEIVLHKLEAKAKEKNVEVNEKGTTIRDQCLSASSSPVSQIKSQKKGCSDNCVKKCMKKNVKIKLACDECGKKLMRDVCLLFHIKQTHERFNAHRCIECNVSFKCYLNYKMHIKEEHLACVEDDTRIQTKSMSMKKFQEPSKSPERLCAEKDQSLSSDDDSVNHEVDDTYSKDFNYSEEENTNKKGKVSRNEETVSNKHYTICSICSGKFKTTLSLIRHWGQSHTTEEVNSDPKYTRTINMHTCNICNKFFNDVRVLRKHEKGEHGIENGVSFNEVEEKQLKQAEVVLENSGLITYKCSFCEMVIKCGRRFLNHIAKHKGELPFPCHLCADSFVKSSQLKAHVKVIHERVKNYKCKVCGREFGDKTNMDDHERRMHNGKPYTCKVCGLSYASSNRLYFHRRVHTNYKPHQCEECKKSYCRKADLEEHMNRRHRPQMSFICEICGKSFATKKSLRRHILAHSDARPHSCSMCQRAFKLKKTLSEHIKSQHQVMKCLTMSSSPSSSTFKSLLQVRNDIMSHSNKSSTEPLFCMYCGRLFVAEQELWTHINQDHLNLANAFSCPHCCQTFQTESELNTHLNMPNTNAMNGNEASISCNKCRKQFSKKILLHQHTCSIREVVGSGFSCNICSSKFTRLVCIRFHQQRQHGISGDLNTKCITCDVAFQSVTDLETHCLKKHGITSSNAQNTSRKSSESPKQSGRVVTIIGKWFDDDDDDDDDDDNDAKDDDDDDFDKNLVEGQSVEDKNQDHDYVSMKTKNSAKKDKVRIIYESGDEDDSCAEMTNSLNCTLCSINFKTKPHLFNHFKTEHTPEEAEEDPVFLSMRNDYFCSLCSKYYGRKSSLVEHKEKFHSVEATVCSLCSVKFENRHDLMNHLKTEHTLEEAEKYPQYLLIKKSFCCDLCSKCFSRKSSLLKHNEKLHSLEKFICSLCTVKFENRHGLFHHLQTVHTPEDAEKDPVYWTMKNSFSCELCSKYFARKAGLLKHNEKFHGQPYVVKKRGAAKDDEDERLLKVCEVRLDDGLIAYKCSYCNKMIMTKRGFVRHVRIHTGERPFTCHICGKQYRSSTDLCRHLRCVHDKIKNYSCDICGRSFANKGSRNDHRRIHTGERPYVCQTCGKSFPTPNSIYLHRRTHTNYFPHKCTNCDKCFRRRQQLIHHLRTHTGEKPHSCDICGKSFGVKDEVTRHRLTHSDLKPFHCPVCHLPFGQKRYVRNHMKVHHSEKIGVFPS